MIEIYFFLKQPQDLLAPTNSEYCSTGFMVPHLHLQIHILRLLTVLASFMTNQYPNVLPTSDEIVLDMVIAKIKTPKMVVQNRSSHLERSKQTFKYLALPRYVLEYTKWD